LLDICASQQELAEMGGHRETIQESTLVLVGILTLGGSMVLATTAPASASTYKAKAKQKPKALPSPHIGQVAKDGDFAFTVIGVQCGVTQIGDPNGLGTTAPAGAQWCLATMTVKADKSQSQTCSSSAQKAVDGRGNQLSADDTTAVYIPNNTSAEFAQVNPGISITAVVPFQLPVTGKITKFILHDSDFSNGVTVYNVG
jgi:hypothetical protein